MISAGFRIYEAAMILLMTNKAHSPQLYSKSELQIMRRQPLTIVHLPITQYATFRAITTFFYGFILNLNFENVQKLILNGFEEWKIEHCGANA